jgi:hypothetical protein
MPHKRQRDTATNEESVAVNDEKSSDSSALSERSASGSISYWTGALTAQ